MNTLKKPCVRVNGRLRELLSSTVTTRCEPSVELWLINTAANRFSTVSDLIHSLILREMKSQKGLCSFSQGDRELLAKTTILEKVMRDALADRRLDKYEKETITDLLARILNQVRNGHSVDPVEVA